MDDQTLRAIDSKIAIAVNALRSDSIKYVTAEALSANSRLLALHRGYGHILSELVPRCEVDIIDYCLAVGVRDVEFIRTKIDTAFSIALPALGSSLAVSYQAPNSAGATMRAALQFQGSVSGYLAGLPARVLVAVERMRHADLVPAGSDAQPRASDDGHPSIHVFGPVQINSHSPGNVQTNVNAPPSSSGKERRGLWRLTERSSWVAGILSLILALIVAGVAFSEKSEKSQAPEHLSSTASNAATGRADPRPLTAVPEERADAVATKPKPLGAASVTTPTSNSDEKELGNYKQQPVVGEPTAPEAPPARLLEVSKARRGNKEGKAMKNTNDSRPIINITGPAMINNGSPGSTQNNFIGRPPPRDLSHPGSRSDLLDRVPRGEKFVIERVSDAESGHFAKEVKDFLVSSGRSFEREVIAFDATWMGVDIFSKQKVKDARGGDYYLIRIGADNGIRGPSPP